MQAAQARLGAVLQEVGQAAGPALPSQLSAEPPVAAESEAAAGRVCHRHVCDLRRWCDGGEVLAVEP